MAAFLVDEMEYWISYDSEHELRCSEYLSKKNHHSASFQDSSNLLPFQATSLINAEANCPNTGSVMGFAVRDCTSDTWSGVVAGHGSVPHRMQRGEGMPRDVLTHEHRRRRICAVCLGKGGQKITQAVLKRIRAIPERRFFNPEDIKLPCGICGTCRVTLSKNGTEDRRAIKNLPKLFRAKRVEPTSPSCPCRWCKKTKTSIIGKLKKKTGKKSDPILQGNQQVLKYQQPLV